MTTDTKTRATTAPRRYLIDDAWLAAHDKALIAKVTADLADRVNRAMPGHNAMVGRRYAQAGVDAITAYYIKAGRLIPKGRTLQIKNLVRDEKGQITAVVDETIVAHEFKRPEPAP